MNPPDTPTPNQDISQPPAEPSNSNSEEPVQPQQPQDFGTPSEPATLPQAPAAPGSQPNPPIRQPMKQRNVFTVILLPYVTLGIYSLYWYVSTKNELNRRGEKIPTAWLIIVPIVNLWWIWKYSEAVESQFGEKLSAPINMLLLLLLGNIG